MLKLLEYFLQKLNHYWKYFKNVTTLVSQTNLGQLQIRFDDV